MPTALLGGGAAAVVLGTAVPAFRAACRGAVAAGGPFVTARRTILAAGEFSVRFAARAAGRTAGELGRTTIERFLVDGSATRQQQTKENERTGKKIGQHRIYTPGKVLLKK